MSEITETFQQMQKDGQMLIFKAFGLKSNFVLFHITKEALQCFHLKPKGPTNSLVAVL